LLELYQYREFVRNLVVRDLKVRYRNSVLGFVWSLLNPLLMMAVFTVVFSILLRNNRPNFPVFVLVALLPWNFATSSVMGSVTSIVGSSHLIKKVYFPREILPISLVLSNLVNFALALPVLLALVLASQIPLTPYALLVPFIMVVQAMFLIGLALLLSCLNVFFRDTENIVDVLVLAWFFLSPIFYNMDELSARWAGLLYWLNPMASFISTYRIILYDHASPDPLFIGRTLFTSLAFLVVGYLVFRKHAPSFGEEI
jgi:lipopolysaccharide transport system permease protein